MRKLIFSLGLCFALSLNTFAQNTEKKVYMSAFVEKASDIKIDGNIDETLWDNVEWDKEFTQHRPNNGEPSSQQTHFKILYDQSNLYVAIKCLDTEPDKIEKQLSRRDGFQGDWVAIYIDSYHDLSSCFSFFVSAAGVKGDEALTGDGRNTDTNFNPIWYTKSQINSEGWTTEMKIPFSQLRFSAAENQVWGLQFMRKIFREEERAIWQPITLDAPGWVSNFGELHGLKNIKPKRQIEIQPYTLAQLKTSEKIEGNPFENGNSSKLSAGLDGKIGLTNDLTLDFTINPDFGQVEADPAAIALDGFQIFFREQRPFFVENRNIFDYAVSRSESQNTYGNDNLFYSRRIGKNPSAYPSLGNNENAEVPDNTTILGAAKVSGKSQKGWSVGILESIADKEYAIIDNNGERREELVEPLTNYFVGRVAREFNNRNTSIGGMLTSTNRKLDGQLSFLHKSAMTGGLDFNHYWKNRSWYLAGNIVMSQVKGSAESITNTQSSIRHLFQRTDADHLELDTTRTQMTGSGGSLKLGKVGGGDFMFESGIAWRSPELEINDIGFQRSSDDIRHHNWMGYRWRKPFSIFLNAAINYNHWVVTNYGGEFNGLAFNINSYVTFKNNWRAGTGINMNPIAYSYSDLRGGPRFRLMPQHNSWLWVNSDNRKIFNYGFELDWGKSSQNSENSYGVSASLTYQPFNALEIRMRQNFYHTKDELQYVSTIYHEGQDKYLMGYIDQKTFGLEFRVNYTINPNLTIQYYGQPFISKGQYSKFKWVKDASSIDLSEKVTYIPEEHITLNEDASAYEFDMSYANQSNIGIGNPDFSFVQFRSNLVVRWEYIPGSELYFVWSQGTTGFGNAKDNLFKSLNTEIFGNTINNIFLLKATYRFAL